jgi:hypothetical protein
MYDMEFMTIEHLAGSFERQTTQFLAMRLAKDRERIIIVSSSSDAEHQMSTSSWASTHKQLDTTSSGKCYVAFLFWWLGIIDCSVNRKGTWYDVRNGWWKHFTGYAINGYYKPNRV